MAAEKAAGGARRGASEPANPLVEAEGLCVRAGRRTLVGPVDLALRAGQWAALIGPNGAGKSTLLRALATLAPFEGTLRFRKQSVADVAPMYRRALGVVMHEPLLYRELSARENLALFARMYGVRRRAAAVRAGLEQVGLAAFADEPVRRFSRGMQQRLALARAMLHGPELLLLDEPLTGVDASGVERMKELFAAAKARGVAGVWVTHHWRRAWPLVDEVWEMSGGRIVRRTVTGEADARRWRPLHADGLDEA